MRPLAILCVVMILAACADAQRPVTRAELAELEATMPWTRQADGTERRDIPLGNEVFRYQTRENGKTSSFDMDQSKAGAVLCWWEIYLAARANMELCHSNDEQWKSVLSYAISSVTSFIADHNLDGLTQDALNKKASDEIERYARASSHFTDEDRRRICKNNSNSFTLEIARQNGIDSFLLSVKDLISTPRIATLNPCL
jgi:hypothetical protein